MKFPARTAAAALFAATGVVVGAQGAVAKESGSFRMLMSGVTDYTRIDHAGTKVTGGSLSGTITVLRSSGGAFAEGETHLLACVVYATTSETDTDVRAACTITDASGDSWFARAQRRAGEIKEGGGGGGKWELAGGTGKYAGLGGSCPYDVEYLPGNRLVSTAECAWKR